jgi:hypothetical protein
MKYAKATLLSLAVGVLLDILIGVLIPDRVMNEIFVVTMSVLVPGILLVAFGTVTKNRWDINVEPVSCPACGSPMPKVRRPESLKQALWGGSTCGKCGCEMDKWGRLITLTRQLLKHPDFTHFETRGLGVNSSSSSDPLP